MGETGRVAKGGDRDIVFVAVGVVLHNQVCQIFEGTQGKNSIVGRLLDTYPQIPQTICCGSQQRHHPVVSREEMRAGLIIVDNNSK